MIPKSVSLINPPALNALPTIVFLTSLLVTIEKSLPPFLLKPTPPLTKLVIRLYALSLSPFFIFNLPLASK